MNGRECLAMVELGADHLTLNKTMMTDLMCSGDLPKYKKGQYKIPVADQINQSGFEWEAWIAPLPEVLKQGFVKFAAVDPLSAMYGADWLEKVTEVDYTAPGVLDKYNEEDLPTKERLDFALDFSKLQEERSKAFIQEKMAGA